VVKEMAIRVGVLVVCAGLLLLSLGAVSLVDYLLHRDDPYFSVPDAVELRIESIFMYSILGVLATLLGWYYENHQSSVAFVSAVTFPVAMGALIGYVTWKNRDFCSCGGYRPPEIFFTLGLFLLLVSVMAVVFLWGRLVVVKFRLAR